MKPVISIIVAHDDNLGIGSTKTNQLLWHISKDLKHFKKLTLGHPIIMGRKTFESIGRVLPNRPHIIITRNPKLYSVPERNIYYFNDLKKAIKLAKSMGNQEIFIIGGGQIYAQALDKVDKLYITHVKGDYNADIFFPKYQDRFKLIKQSALKTEGRHKFIYLTYYSPPNLFSLTRH